jgi:hypothetical protein
MLALQMYTTTPGQCMILDGPRSEKNCYEGHFRNRLRNVTMFCVIRPFVTMLTFPCKKDAVAMKGKCPCTYKMHFKRLRAERLTVCAYLQMLREIHTKSTQRYSKCDQMLIITECRRRIQAIHILLFFLHFCRLASFQNKKLGEISTNLKIISRKEVSSRIEMIDWQCPLRGNQLIQAVRGLHWNLFSSYVLRGCHPSDHSSHLSGFSKFSFCFSWADSRLQGLYQKFTCYLISTFEANMTVSVYPVFQETLKKKTKKKTPT